MAQGPLDLIYLAGAGNSISLRINGREAGHGGRPTDMLTGEFVVNTPFVSGTLIAWVSPSDLTEWQECLDTLDVGHSVSWRDMARGPALSIERDEAEDRYRVTIRDNVTTLTTVTVTIPLPDSWFDDAYDRLELVRKTWPV